MSPGQVIPSPTVSFVVPTLNEEGCIEGLLTSIASACPPSLTYEVIVADNGSIDHTVELAHQHGAEVLFRPEGTVGHIRNEGARQAKGRVLIFLDADIRLTAEWAKEIGVIIEQLQADPHTISGSACLAAPDSSWIAKAWTDFESRPRTDPTHIGTGHMLVERDAFLELGGFNDALETGEDFEFCQRARALGFELRRNDALRVIHARLPSSPLQFLRREIWHGKGDSDELGRIFRSPVALAALAFVGMHIGAAGWIVLGPPSLRWPSLAAAGAGVVLLCLVGAVRRGGIGKIRLLLQRSALFYLYYWGRFIAIVQGLLRIEEASRIRRRGW